MDPRAHRGPVHADIVQIETDPFEQIRQNLVQNAHIGIVARRELDDFFALVARFGQFRLGLIGRQRCSKFGQTRIGVGGHAGREDAHAGLAQCRVVASQRANEIALNGVREEARVGQRTTLDVLNSQQTLLTSRANLITAQRDQVVNSFALVLAMGRMNAVNLGLRVDGYDPTVHYDQVKGKMWGLRTPDGR